MEIRPCTEDDLPEVAALRRRVFRRTRHTDLAALTAYMRRVFFRSPWHDPELPSLVGTAEGRVVGFVGVIPRPLRMGSRALRAAVGTQLMVDPAWRGAATLRLVRRLVDGPQDITYADMASTTVRRLWERLGHHTAVGYSLQWVCPLKPAVYYLRGLDGRLPGRLLRTALHPVATLLDALTAPAPPAPPRVHVTPLTSDAAATLADELADRWVVAPRYDGCGLRWLWSAIATKGTVHQGLVRDHAGRALGWFQYVQSPDAVATVTQVVARPQRFADVLDALLAHAREAGAMAVTGRTEPCQLSALAARGCHFLCDGPWVLVQSRDVALQNAFYQGTAWLTRLEGEWWTDF